MWTVVQTAVLALMFRVERGMVGLAGLVYAKIVICFCSLFPRLRQEIENCERADAAAVKPLRTSTEQLGHHTAHAICHGMVYVEY